MASKKSSKKDSKNSKKSRFLQIICLLVVIVVAGAYCVGLIYQDDIDQALGLLTIEHGQPGDKIEVDKLTVHFIDVGQGDACLIELPDNRTMIIDAGENRTTVKEKLDSYIADVNTSRVDNGKNAITRFDYGIVTHSDSDHIGSMSYLLSKISAKVFYRPNEQATNAGYSDPALTKSNSGTFWTDGVNSWGSKDTVTYKNTIESIYNTSDTVYVTNPADNYQNTITPSVNSSHSDYYEINFYGHTTSCYNDHNDYSPIIIITYKNRRIALSGDCETKGEGEFVTKANSSDPRYSIFNGSFYVDVIKLGHHGSRTSSTEPYLTTLVPSETYRANVFIVISCGEGNSYGHPHEEVLARLDDLKFSTQNILRTDQTGDIVIDLVLYEGETSAYAVSSGIAMSPKTYTYIFANIEIRYKTVGLLIVSLLALFLIPLSLLSTKTKNKILKSAKSNLPTKK